MKIVPGYAFAGWMLLTSFTTPTDCCRKLDFVVFKGDDQVGTLTANEKIEGKRTTYSLLSHVTIRLLFTFKIIENINNVFENGHLKSSVHTRHINGSLKTENRIQRIDSNAYTMTDADKTVKHINEAIHNTILELYFKEPIETQRRYSENFQQLLLVKKTDAHVYTVELPNGNVTTYHYNQGVLALAETKASWGVLKFINKTNLAGLKKAKK